MFIWFYLGDLRVNETPTLGVMHLLWVREHNRLARQLKKINSQWDDERLYLVKNIFFYRNLLEYNTGKKYCQTCLKRTEWCPQNGFLITRVHYNQETNLMTISYVCILIYYYVKCAWSNKFTIQYNSLKQGFSTL